MPRISFDNQMKILLLTYFRCQFDAAAGKISAAPGNLPAVLIEQFGFGNKKILGGHNHITMAHACTFAHRPLKIKVETQDPLHTVIL
jgi:hypothetical protein